MIIKALRYLVAYVMWIITLLTGLWFIIVSREGFHNLLTTVYVRNSPTYASRANLYEKVFFLVVGLLWGILMIVSEEYYRKAALTNQIWVRVAKITGPVLLATFLADAGLLLLNGIQYNNWLRWIILVLELIIGVALTLYARSAKSLTPAKETR